jgi:hypothetical protein
MGRLPMLPVLVVAATLLGVYGTQTEQGADVPRVYRASARAGSSKDTPLSAQPTQQSQGLSIARINERRDVQDLFAARAWGQNEPLATTMTPTAKMQSTPIRRPPIAEAQMPVLAPVQALPPLPFKFVGRLRHGDDPVIAFLTHGEVYYEVKVGDTLEQNYRIARIEDDAIEFVHLPSNQKQSLPVKIEN